MREAAPVSYGTRPTGSHALLSATLRKEVFCLADVINREHKDCVFKFVFGNAEKKAWTLSLYNAVNGSAYTDPEVIQFNTIEDAVYMLQLTKCVTVLN